MTFGIKSADRKERGADFALDGPMLETTMETIAATVNTVSTDSANTPAPTQSLGEAEFGGAESVFRPRKRTSSCCRLKWDV